MQLKIFKLTNLTKAIIYKFDSINEMHEMKYKKKDIHRNKIKIELKFKTLDYENYVAYQKFINQNII